MEICGILVAMDMHEAVPGLYCIQVPIPSPLRHVNCWLARGGDGWTIVDTGFHTPEAESAWLEAFRRLGIAPGDVARIIVTHYHPDHYGAAGWLQQLTGAPVLMHEPEAATAQRIWSGQLRARFGAFFHEHGVPPALMEPLARLGEQNLARTQPAPEITPVRDGDRIPIGDRRFQVLWTPGHTDGLIVLWNADEGILLADDMVLSPISPNISAGPTAGPDPLGAYLASLERVGRIPARITLTGHRRPISDLAARCAELRQHHHDRLELALQLVGDGATAWEVGQGLFGELINSTANLMFALGETVAHLEYLRARGRVESWRDENGILRYRRRCAP